MYVPTYMLLILVVLSLRPQSTFFMKSGINNNKDDDDNFILCVIQTVLVLQLQKDALCLIAPREALVQY